MITVTELNPTVSADAVIDALREVYDPELGVDIVSLGLVYDLHIAGDSVHLMMTLTTPGCPLHGTIKKEVLLRLEQLPGVGWVDIQLVWDPPWSPERISDEARQTLYWL